MNSFEVIGWNLARDQSNVWWYGSPLPGIDSESVELVKEGFVWKDAHSVGYQHERIHGANLGTFRHLGQAFYADRNRVYWSNEVLNEADPDTFRTFGDDSPYGADQRHVWKANTRVPGLNARSFEHVHQSIYKDRNGVYLDGQTIKDADSATFGKLADLDQQLTALLADDQKHYIFLPLYGDIFGIELTDDALQVSRPGQQIPFAELTESGWNIQQDTPDVSNRETHVLGVYLTQFQKAREILRNTIENQASWLEPKRRNGNPGCHKYPLQNPLTRYA